MLLLKSCDVSPSRELRRASSAKLRIKVVCLDYMFDRRECALYVDQFVATTIRQYRGKQGSSGGAHCHQRAKLPKQEFFISRWITPSYDPGLSSPPFAESVRRKNTSGKVRSPLATVLKDANAHYIDNDELLRQKEGNT